MKKTLSISIGAAVAIALFGASAPARAFSFGTDGISFNSDTEVKFSFGSSNGAFQSTLKIFEVLTDGSLAAAENGVVFEETQASDNGAQNGFEATLGNAVTQVNDTFTFLAGKVYTLGLASTYNGNNQGIAYSTTSLNTYGQRAAFGTTGGTEAQAFDASSYQSADPFSGPVAIAFEDIKWAGADGDFNDFTVSAQAVPEPLTMGGLALGAAGLAAARRSRKRRTSES